MVVDLLIGPNLKKSNLLMCRIMLGLLWLLQCRVCSPPRGEEGFSYFSNFINPAGTNLTDCEHASRLGNARDAVKPPQWGALMKLCKLLFVCTVCLGPGVWGFIRVCDQLDCVDYYQGV